MKDIEEQIEEAALAESKKIGTDESGDYITYRAFILGAKSNAAKEFHQQGMFSPEDMIAFGDYCYNEYSESPFSFRELLANWIEQNKRNDTIILTHQKSKKATRL